jgi:hypothetical protein
VMLRKNIKMMVFSSIYGAFVIEGSHALESPSVVAFMGRRGPLARARAPAPKRSLGCEARVVCGGPI